MLQFALNPPFGMSALQLADFRWVDAWLLEHEGLSRNGRLDDQGLLERAQLAKLHGFRAVLVWDLLPSDDQIEACTRIFKRLDPTNFDAVRVQDPGVAQFLFDHFPNVQLEYIAETGNHNLAALKAWQQNFGPRLERLVLSNEIPINQVTEMRRAIAVPLEIQIMGRLLLFYSPRQLLRHNEPSAPKSGPMQRFIAGEDRPNRFFPVVENQHGTLMYYEKDLFLLPYLHEIQQAGVAWVRLDCKFYHPGIMAALEQYLNSGPKASPEEIHDFLPAKVTRGFFKSNRTDKQLAKLKNQSLDVDPDTLLAEVLEVKKPNYLALYCAAPLAKDQVVKIATPEGHVFNHRISWMRSLDGTALDTSAPHSLVLINHRGSVSPGAKVLQN